MDLSDHLPSRSIIPLIYPLPVTRGEKATCRIGNEAPSEELPDLKDVQGDVVFLFSKRAENFIFFRIANLASFRAALARFQPSNSYDTGSFVWELYQHRRSAFQAGVKPSIIKRAGYQIAFTRMGMNFLGVRSPTGDTRFDKRAMRDDKGMLGDQAQWDPVFDKKNADPVNGSADKDDETTLHGVITVVGSDPDSCKQYSDETKALFGSSIKVVSTLEGRARPGANAGHEHFGYEDGVSQPALRNLSNPNPGQIQVNPGVIIMGYKGDPVVDYPDIAGGRPAWTKGGTMMVFRKLEQDVPAFNEYLKKNGRRWKEFAPPGCPELTDEEGAELWGARLIGRWKSGAPVALCPYKDDPQLAVDSKRNNNFDYRVRGVPGVSPREHSALYCPFFAHTRKTVPRNLDPYIQQAFLESSMIVRGGLPYGPELEEDQNKERGLLFVCYQSSLDGGFIQQTAFAGNDYFPTTSLVPQYHGKDTVLGGPPVGPAAVTKINYVEAPKTPPSSGDPVNLVTTYNGNNIEVSGFAKVTPSSAVNPPGVPPEFFVTSHGGEYFFVPPISTLKKWASGGGSPGLDLMFILDATSSMQKYIDEARDRIAAIYDEVQRLGALSPDDIRVGLIAFRDHPQLDRHGAQQSYGFVTKKFNFESDISVVKANLASLKASGGGDGPEAQCDALQDALVAAWRKNAKKIVIMITDSPTHGIDEYEDKLPDGCPETLENDPVRIVREMAGAGIILHVLACEPTLSGSFSKAHDFYEGITKITGGKMVGLTDQVALQKIIVGNTIESLDIQRLVVENRTDIDSQSRGGAASAAISKGLYTRLSSAGTQIYAFESDSIYLSDETGDYNAEVWANAKQIDANVRGSIRTVRNSRLKEEYRRGSSKDVRMELKKKTVTQSQVDTIVDVCLKLK
ncbi:hypothetical protein GYMLUDRAFT_68574 [Collybiopsis luxurians FD-317 M1]|nr:hypothetical protein GYMLUDRAFT_68574 [Collybiopsis luxurians FD-317 M1]